jgi:hypothetical protein
VHAEGGIPSCDSGAVGRGCRRLRVDFGGSTIESNQAAGGVCHALSGFASSVKLRCRYGWSKIDVIGGGGVRGNAERPAEGVKLVAIVVVMSTRREKHCGCGVGEFEAAAVTWGAAHSRKPTVKVCSQKGVGGCR